jgi:hypothetical protein
MVPLWERLLTAQVQGRSDARERARLETRPAPAPVKRPKPITFQRSNYTIRRSDIILDDVNGDLEELMVKSSSEFSIEINADGRQLIHKSVTELIDISEDVGDIVAVLRDGVYRFNIRNIRFDSIFVRVFLAGTGSFGIYYKVVLDDR